MKNHTPGADDQESSMIEIEFRESWSYSSSSRSSNYMAHLRFIF